MQTITLAELQAQIETIAAQKAAAHTTRAVMTERLMRAAEVLLAQHERLEVVYDDGRFVHVVTLTGRGSGADAPDCWLVREENGVGRCVPFAYVYLPASLATRLDAIASEAETWSAEMALRKRARRFGHNIHNGRFTASQRGGRP